MAAERWTTSSTRGFYPRIIDQGLAQTQALADYFETYVERDVRRIGEIRQLSHFRRFMRLCAGRVGQPVNLSSLGSDAGVSHTTAREWLTILETSYIIFQLSSVPCPDPQAPGQVPPAVLLRRRAGRLPDRDRECRPTGDASAAGSPVRERGSRRGPEAPPQPGAPAGPALLPGCEGLELRSLLYPTDHGIAAIDVTAGATIATDSFRSVHRVAGLVPGVSQEIVVYGGTVRQTRSDSEAIPLGGVGRSLGKARGRPGDSRLCGREQGTGTRSR